MSITSGGKNIWLPFTPLYFDLFISAVDQNCFVNPKSQIFNKLFLSRRAFAGLKSLIIMLLWCKKEIPSTIYPAKVKELFFWHYSICEIPFLIIFESHLGLFHDDKIDATFLKGINKYHNILVLILSQHFSFKLCIL